MSSHIYIVNSRNYIGEFKKLGGIFYLFFYFNPSENSSVVFLNRGCSYKASVFCFGFSDSFLSLSVLSKNPPPPPTPLVKQTPLSGKPKNNKKENNTYLNLTVDDSNFSYVSTSVFSLYPPSTSSNFDEIPHRRLL